MVAIVGASGCRQELSAAPARRARYAFRRRDVFCGEIAVSQLQPAAAAVVPQSRRRLRLAVSLSSAGVHRSREHRHAFTRPWHPSAAKRPSTRRTHLARPGWPFGGREAPSLRRAFGRRAATRFPRSCTRHPNRVSFSPTSPPGTWTTLPPKRSFSSCCSNFTAKRELAGVLVTHNLELRPPLRPCTAFRARGTLLPHV